jgi:hypothetical protein
MALRSRRIEDATLPPNFGERATTTVSMPGSLISSV